MGMKRNVLLSFVITLLLVSTSVFGANWTVCPSGCDYTSIQTAIDGASANDIIEVGAGTYSETIVVNVANLTIVSTEFETTGSTTKNTTLIDAGGIANVAVTITADGVTLQGLTIFNYRWGVFVDDSNATIDNCIIYDTGVHYVETPRDYEGNRGIHVSLTQASASSVNITNNEVYDNWRGDAGTNSSRMNMAGRGIYAGSDVTGNNNSVLIHNNEVYGSDQSGIYVRKVTATITNNYVHDNGFDGLDEMQWCVGIMVGYSEGTILIENNVIERIKAPWTQYGSISSGGIILYGPTWTDDPHYGIIRINNNTIDTGSASSGINIHNPSDADWDVYITNNTISGTTGDPREILPTYGGIQIWNAKRVESVLIPELYADIYTCDKYSTHVDVIEGNTIRGHEIGIVMINASVGSLQSNNIYNNTEYGINVTDAEEVDATNNWWGSAIPNASKFSDNVTYYPFCLNEGCTVTMGTTEEEFSGGDTTDFSAITDWENVDLVLDNVNGKIDWASTVNLTDSSLLFSDNVEMGYRSISIDTDDMPELDSPATLTFKGSGYTGLRQVWVFRNGALCPDSICTSVTIVNGAVVVTVTQLSDYTLMTSTLIDIGEGFGNLLSQMAGPLTVFIILMGIATGIAVMFKGVWARAFE